MYIANKTFQNLLTFNKKFDMLNIMGVRKDAHFYLLASFKSFKIFSLGNTYFLLQK